VTAKITHTTTFSTFSVAFTFRIFLTGGSTDRRQIWHFYLYQTKVVDLRKS